MAEATDQTGPVPPTSTPPEAPFLRGQTVVSARALAAVAGQAASEVDGVEVVSRTGLRRLLQGLLPGGSRGAPASAAVAAGSTALELRLAVTWPRPVGAVTSEARRHVRRQVEELTGFTVTEVDIVVDALPEAGGRLDRRVG